ncbi:MAG TPA: long-chain fatty acid--CoA ligase, partial [Vicinamibacteria bacterium]
KVSSETWLARSRHLALGLRLTGIEKGDRVALLSENRHEWFLVDAALQILGAVNVPIYSTLPAPQAAYILKDSESKAVVVSDAVQQKKIAEIRPGLPSLSHVVTLDPASGIEATPIETIEARGRKEAESKPGAAEKLASAVRPEDLASIVYTSGTSGDPKGVMLTHRNFVSNVKASRQVLPLDSTDRALSALPYSHVFERMVGLYLYPSCGVSVALAGSIESVIEDIGQIRPTVMTMVPRFYEKMYARVKESAASGSPTKRKIFEWAIATGKEHGEYRLRRESPPFPLSLKYKIATALVFKKLHHRLGGELRFFVSGSAPLSKEIADFFWAAGITILEGYGLTETSPVISVNRPDRIRFGTVGPAVPGVEVEIAPDGEILARGENVMKGYWKKEAATGEAIDSRGFFHTGDIGTLDRDGFLSITDRKKDIIVTSGGKNIAPQVIEGKLKTNAFIADVVVVGNQRSFASALVIPNFEKLLAWCREQAIPASSREDVASNPRVYALLMEQVERVNSEFAQYERVKKIILLAQEFTIERGELTPTLKARRSVIESRYKHLIDELYHEQKPA